MRSYFHLNFRRHLPRKRDIPILDFGCGDGEFAAWMKSLGYQHVFKYDPNHSIIGPYDKLCGYQRNFFGVIVLKHVLYYVPKAELESYFSEFRRILTADGQMVIEVFNGASLSSAWIKDKDDAIRFTLNERSLRQLLERHGFVVMEMLPESYKVDSPRRWLWLLSRRIWFRILSAIYILERGQDESNPTIFSKNLIVTCRPEPTKKEER